MNREHVFRFVGAILCLLLSTTTFTQRIYVKPDGQGDGSSWAHAAGDLAQIMAKATPGTEIWVAQGVYTPGEHRHDAFVLRNGVAVYGGFFGNEQTLAQRDVYRRPTVLSGEIGSSSVEDNAYNVVVVSGWSDATRLDGFVIRGGCANGVGEPSSRLRCGGGIYIEGHEQEPSQVQIVNCTIEDNYARDGGAVFVASSYGRKADPAFIACVFRDNRADLDGGAIYVDARLNGQSRPQFWYCTFQQNLGNYGGALFANGYSGVVEMTVRDCTFQQNNAYVRGGAIYHMDSNGTASSAITACRFVETYDAYGSENVLTYSLDRILSRSIFSRL